MTPCFVCCNHLKMFSVPRILTYSVIFFMDCLVIMRYEFYMSEIFSHNYDFHKNKNVIIKCENTAAVMKRSSSWWCTTQISSVSFWLWFKQVSYLTHADSGTNIIFIDEKFVTQEVIVKYEISSWRRAEYFKPDQTTIIIVNIIIMTSSCNIIMTLCFITNLKTIVLVNLLTSVNHNYYELQ